MREILSKVSPLLAGPLLSCVQFPGLTAYDILAQLSYLQQPFSPRPHELSRCTWAVGQHSCSLLCPLSPHSSCLTNLRDHSHSKLYLYLFSSFSPLAGCPYSPGFHFLIVQLVSPGRKMKKIWSSLLCFSSLEDHSPTMFIVKCLESVTSDVYSCFHWEDKSSISHCVWPEVGILLYIFWIVCTP